MFLTSLRYKILQDFLLVLNFIYSMNFLINLIILILQLNNNSAGDLPVAILGVLW